MKTGEGSSMEVLDTLCQRAYSKAMVRGQKGASLIVAPIDFVGCFMHESQERGIVKGEFDERILLGQPILAYRDILTLGITLHSSHPFFATVTAWSGDHVVLPQVQTLLTSPPSDFDPLCKLPPEEQEYERALWTEYMDIWNHRMHHLVTHLFSHAKPLAKITLTA